MSARLVIAMLAGLVLAGCDAQGADNRRPNDDIRRRADVWIDHETGCQYLMPNSGSSAMIVPRLGADGKPMCGAAGKEPS